jgi:hypothetical protein
VRERRGGPVRAQARQAGQQRAAGGGAGAQYSATCPQHGERIHQELAPHTIWHTADLTS